jgi:hypothetical protein
MQEYVRLYGCMRSQREGSKGQVKGAGQRDLRLVVGCLIQAM